MPGAGVPSVGLVLGVLMILATTGYYLARARAVRAGGRGERLHSLPSYHGYYVALWCGIPGALLFLLWVALGPHVVDSLVVAALPEELRSLPPDRLGLVLNDIRNIAGGSAFGGPSDPALLDAARRYNDLTRIGYAGLTVSTLALATLGLALARRKIAVRFRARVRVERTVRAILVLCSTISILITVGIVLSLLFEAIRFFRLVPIVDFLFGVEWSPQTAIRAGQVASAGAFGMVPLFAGTLLITAIAMLVAVPVGLMAAIQTSEYASRPARAVIKPVLELLAGIPTVVYGFFAALIVAPALRDAGVGIGLDIASESALAAGLVMGIMIIPFISSISDDVITAVPQALRDGSYALGATRSETIRRVVIPAALPGIVGGVLLAVSRAIGETMIVVMAAGLAANMTVNPLEAVTTVTVQMVTLLVGDQEFESAKTLAAFALGLVLFLVTLALNVVALGVVRKYRERYE
ncbi:MAG: phosphate ABC transporter permease subunit PstC [Alphaproteobacteria bacterium]